MNNNHFLVLILGCVLFGFTIWTVMLYFTWDANNVEPNKLLTHLGETGATLSLITVIGGMVRAVLKERDEIKSKKEEQRQFYKNLLTDIKSVYDKVERLRLLTDAHRSAKTYGEQSRQLIDGVITLHNVRRVLNPEHPDLMKKLKPSIDNMIKFLKILLAEYSENYKQISQLQESDQAWNENLKSQIGKELKPNDFNPISRAWEKIADLQALRILRDENLYKEYEYKFIRHLDNASLILRKYIMNTK